MNDLPINPLDAAVFIVLLLSALLAFTAGFVKVSLGLVKYIGASVVANLLFPYTAPIARDLVGGSSIGDIAADPLAYGSVFLVVLIIFTIITNLIAGKVQKSQLSGLDRTLGVPLGLLRGTFIIVVCFVVGSWLLSEKEWPRWAKEAKTLPLIQKVSNLAMTAIPEDLLELDTLFADDGKSNPDRKPTRLESLKKQMDAVDEQIKKTNELQERFNRLNSPQPKAKERDKEDPAYKPSERNDLNRLIESTQ
jgi:membrane protein required for colicin V production